MKNNGCTRNARFWVLVHDSYVKLRLRPDESLTHLEYRRDDEGFSSSGETWTHEGSNVLLQWFSRGRDCDGVVSDAGECAALLDDLAAVVRDDGSPPFPLWKRRGPNRHSDQFAEAMNY